MLEDYSTYENKDNYKKWNIDYLLTNIKDDIFMIVKLNEHQLLENVLAFNDGFLLVTNESYLYFQYKSERIDVNQYSVIKDDYLLLVDKVL